MGIAHHELPTLASRQRRILQITNYELSPYGHKTDR